LGLGLGLANPNPNPNPNPSNPNPNPTNPNANPTLTLTLNPSPNPSPNPNPNQALVPSPLLELRYLTLPVLLLRLHAPPLAGRARWLPPLLAFAAINAAAVAVFIARPYTWVDGTTARLMW
jgi:hypothetical protein